MNFRFDPKEWEKRHTTKRGGIPQSGGYPKKEEDNQPTFDLVATEEINGAMCDFYTAKKDVWVAREQIGAALGYDDPRRSVAKIHNRHKERLDKFSRVVKLTTVEGTRQVERDFIVYNRRGFLEICRWSRQPKADEVMDRLYDIAEKLLTEGYVSLLPDGELVKMICERASKDPHGFQKNIKSHKQSVVATCANLLGCSPFSPVFSARGTYNK